MKNELLQEKEVFKYKFINNFSHEVKGPLNLINAFSSLLLKGTLDLEQTKLVEDVKEQSDTLESIWTILWSFHSLKRKNQS